MSTAAEQNAAGTPQLTLNGIEVPDVVPLETPSAPIPTLITTESGLRRAAEQLAAASGPVAVDTERAQGIRYGSRAFLVQLKREDQLYLIDPEALRICALLTMLWRMLSGLFTPQFRTSRAWTCSVCARTVCLIRSLVHVLPVWSA